MSRRRTLANPPPEGLAVWYVARSHGASGPGPRLYWLPVLRRTAKMIYLATPYSGRKAIRRSRLPAWLLYETPGEAMAAFGDRAARWLRLAREEVRHAERDLAFARVRSTSSALRFARDGSTS